ncbi:MAG TPA: DUF1549 and DUF1553 domain-containing protein [Planctomycetota bacterium]|nr:DUF1549 and DUF1553 domain-containing protein [Planctomycetota bacterium]
MRSGLISFIALGMMALTPLLLAEETPLSESTDGDEGLVIGARDPKVFNEIDRFILTRLRAESIEPSAICSDYEFARRVYVDVLGVIPTPEEIRAFAGDKSEDKRAKLIDKLLRDNERYADHWEVMWGDWLREHSVAKKKEGTAQGSYREWLRQALKSNMPYDQFARKLLTASGSPSDNGAVNFFIRDQQNRVETVNTMAQAFMGTRMACAQCHDHPFDKWTQTDFHGLMAYFGQTAVSKPPKKGKEYEESGVHDNSKGEYHMPADGDSAAKKGNKGGEIVKPVFAWNPSITTSASGTRREQLANAVIGSPQFAQVQANRLWAQLMGRGIVEPPDDFRAKNPPSHPELLEFLADQLVKAHYDSKHVLRLILNSAAYQRSSMPTETNRNDAALFSHQRVRRLTAEELFDSILVAAGHDKGLEEVPGALAANNQSAQKKGNMPAAGRKKGAVEWAADLPTPAKTGTFMNLFNQPPRDTIVTRRDESGAVTQALEMLNGKAVNDAIQNSPLIDHLFASKTDARHAVNELYLATLTRQPTSEEVETAVKHAANSREWLVDLQWALMNAREFTFIR